MTGPISFDWAEIVEQLLARGVEPNKINGSQFIEQRVVAHYRRGVQPLHWRGELMLLAWCAEFKTTRDKAPVCPVIRGHRVDRRLSPGPRCQNPPQWPAAAPASVKPIKRRGTVEAA